MRVRGCQFGLSQCLDGSLDLCFLFSVEKHWFKILGELSVPDTRTLKQLSSHWLASAACFSSEVQKGKNKFAVVVGKQVCVADCVKSLLSVRDLVVDSLCPIQIARYRDFSNWGVVQ